MKIAWAAHHFPTVKMITCLSKEKRLHMMNPGDVLVDGYLRYIKRPSLEKAGGTFIHHVSVSKLIRQLAELGCL